MTCDLREIPFPFPSSSSLPVHVYFIPRSSVYFSACSCLHHSIISRCTFIRFLYVCYTRLQFRLRHQVTCALVVLRVCVLSVLDVLNFSSCFHILHICRSLHVLRVFRLLEALHVLRVLDCLHVLNLFCVLRVLHFEIRPRRCFTFFRVFDILGVLAVHLHNCTLLHGRRGLEPTVSGHGTVTDHRSTLARIHGFVAAVCVSGSLGNRAGCAHVVVGRWLSTASRTFHSMFRWAIHPKAGQITMTLRLWRW